MTSPLDWFSDILECWITENKDFYRPIEYWRIESLRIGTPSPLDWLWDIIECWKEEG